MFVCVLVACAEVDVSVAFPTEDLAEAWASGAAAGAGAFGGDECDVLVLPRDDTRVLGFSDYLRGEVWKARDDALSRAARAQGYDVDDGRLFVRDEPRRVLVPCRRCGAELPYQGQVDGFAIGPRGEVLYPLAPVITYPAEALRQSAPAPTGAVARPTTLRLGGA